MNVMFRKMSKQKQCNVSCSSCTFSLSSLHSRIHELLSTTLFKFMKVRFTAHIETTYFSSLTSLHMPFFEGSAEWKSSCESHKTKVVFALYLFFFSLDQNRNRSVCSVSSWSLTFTVTLSALNNRATTTRSECIETKAFRGRAQERPSVSYIARDPSKQL